MKKPIQILVAAMLMFATFSCEKNICTTCSVVTNAPGASEYYTYCGTASEINKEEVRIKNGCEDLKVQYPQHTFDCGCN